MNPSSSFGYQTTFVSIGGEELTNEELTASRRRDFGPIGSKVHRKPMTTVQDEGYMYSWVSDYLNQPTCTSATARGEEETRGIVPSLPNAAPPKSPVQDNNNDFGYQRSYNTAATFEQHVHVSRYMDVSTMLDTSWCSVSTSSSNLSGGDSIASPVSPQTAGQQAGGNSCSNSNNNADSDLEDFASRYGFVGKARPKQWYKARKGKYFKEFC